MKEEYEQTANQNTQYQTSSIIQWRLDTTRLIAEIEAHLKGTRLMGITEDKETGIITPVFADMGVPRLNEEGIQEVMSWVNMLIGPHTVQGNTEHDDFPNRIADIREDVASALMEKMPDYDIKETDYNSIIDKLMQAIEFFLSRTIDNLERESYTNTLKSVERVGNDRTFGSMLGGAFKKGG